MFAALFYSTPRSFSLCIKILLTLLLLRLCYLLIQWLYQKLTDLAEFIIVGSEYYWKRKWLLSHKKNERIEYKNIDTYNPKRGWTLIPNLKDKLFKGSLVNSNSNGARGGGDEFLDNMDSVLFLGDSFCFGEDVDDDETIPYFFAKKIGSAQSINLGVHGYGIDQQYLYLKETAAKYKPKIVCFIISYDDFNRNFLGFRDYAKPMFNLKNGEIALTNYPVPEPGYYLKTAKDVPSLVVFIDFFRQILIYYGLIDRKRREKICLYLLEQIMGYTQKLNSKLIFLYIPNMLNGLYKNYVNNFFINFFKQNKISYINLSDAFTKSQLLSITDSSRGHFKARGNELIAEKLIELVKDIK